MVVARAVVTPSAAARPMNSRREMRPALICRVQYSNSVIFTPPIVLKLVKLTTRMAALPPRIERWYRKKFKLDVGFAAYVEVRTMGVAQSRPKMQPPRARRLV